MQQEQVQSTVIVSAKKERRKQEVRSAEAKSAIRKAALELFALQGYDMTTLSQISTRAGFSRGLAQYHYKTKEALAEEILDQSMLDGVRLYSLQPSDETRGMDIIEHLEYQVEASAKEMSALFLGKRSLEWRGKTLLTSVATISPNEKLRKKIQESNRVIGSKIAPGLEAGIEEGIVKQDVDPEGAAAFYIGAIWGLINEFYGEPLHHDRVLKGFETLKQAVRSWRRSDRSAFSS